MSKIIYQNKNMSNFIYRKASLGDSKDVNNIFKESFILHKEYDVFLDQSWPGKQGVKYFEEKIKKDFVMVCTLDIKIIGVIVGEIKRIPFYKDVSGEVLHMCVKEEFRSMGVGQKLIEEFLDYCRDKKIKVVEVIYSYKNSRAGNFYKKLGFDEDSIMLRKHL